MSMLDKYNKFASEQNKAMQVFTAILRDSLPFIILIVNIVVSVLMSLFDPSLQNPFSADFFIRLFMNMLTTMVCYSCFVNYGEKNEKLSSETYASNVKKWSEMSGKIRQSCTEKFMVYCRKQVEIEREDIRHFYILNYTMITIEEYESKYKRLSEEDIDKLVLKGSLNRREAKYIKKANKSRYLKPINPILILCGVNKMNLNDVGRDGMRAATTAIVTRPVLMFALSTIGAMLGATWKGIDSASAVFNIIYSVLMIIIASITGYSAGTDAGRKEADKIKARIFFIEKFNSEEGLEQ